MRYLWIAGLMLCCLTACSIFKKPIVSAKEDKATVADAKGSIAEMNARWITAMKNKDAETIAQLFDADEGALMSASGKVYQGHDAIRELMERNFKALGSITATIKTDNVWLEGNIAYETGYWRYVFIPTSKRRNKKELRQGHYLVIWKRQPDKSWRILKDFGFTDK